MIRQADLGFTAADIACKRKKSCGWLDQAESDGKFQLLRSVSHSSPVPRLFTFQAHSKSYVEPGLNIQNQLEAPAHPETCSQGVGSTDSGLFAYVVGHYALIYKPLTHHSVLVTGPLSSSSPGSGTSEKTGMPTIRPSTESITAHLNALLSPLSLSNIPDALAERLVTHRTAAGRLGNHNGRLAFYGRRVLHFHLALALHKQGHISQALLEQHLTPVELGRSGGVAAKLRLEQIMRWRPSLPSTVPMHNASQEDALGRGSGLWKLRGETLQSLQGAVWSHYVSSSSLPF